ncbi:hypothetical protein SEA_VIEENROSE_25 [Streptomyces phage VieEnRose]|nr:hypothetical protein SEA_VIEENROSE_25 [Streptomyces phage VieEnRose]
MGVSLYPPPTAPAPAPVTVTSGLTPATNFSVNSFFATKMGGVCTISTSIKTTNGISTSASAPFNIADTTVATLPSGWRPRATVTAIFSTGYADGEADIRTDGSIILRTTNTYPIDPGGDFLVSATFVL